MMVGVVLRLMVVVAVLGHAGDTPGQSAAARSRNDTAALRVTAAERPVPREREPRVNRRSGAMDVSESAPITPTHKDNGLDRMRATFHEKVADLVGLCRSDGAPAETLNAISVYIVEDARRPDNPISANLIALLLLIIAILFV